MKKSQIDRAIQELEDQRRVIDAAVDILKAMRLRTATRRPRVVKKAGEGKDVA